MSLLPDDEYRKLQVLLANRPTAGDLIRGSGGLRKIRWALPNQGKRGGVRVIYYWAVRHERLLMLFMYPKTERGDPVRAASPRPAGARRSDARADQGAAAHH